MEIILDTRRTNSSFDGSSSFNEIGWNILEECDEIIKKDAPKETDLANIHKLYVQAANEITNFFVDDQDYESMFELYKKFGFTYGQGQFTLIKSNDLYKELTGKEYVGQSHL